MATRTKSRAPAKKTSTAVVDTPDYGEDYNSGFENQRQEDLTIPFVSVLQGLSDQVQNNEKARVGMLFNNVTEELIDGAEGLIFVPAYTEHCFIEWKTRKQGGGFVAKHELGAAIVEKAKKDSTEFGKYSTEYDKKGQCVGNDIVETYYIWAAVCDGAEAFAFAVLSFTSTKIKIYKKWNTKVHMFQIPTGNGRKARPPIFAHLTHLTTKAERNAEGEFFNYALAPAKGDLKSSLLAPDDARLKAAKSLRDLCLEGMVEAKQDDTQQPDSREGGPDWNE